MTTMPDKCPRCGEADHYRQQYETLRAAVEDVAERIGEAADYSYGEWRKTASDYLQGRAHAMEHVERIVRRILSDGCPFCGAPAVDDPGVLQSGLIAAQWTCGTWRSIDGETFCSDGCGARRCQHERVDHRERGRNSGQVHDQSRLQHDS